MPSFAPAKQTPKRATQFAGEFPTEFPRFSEDLMVRQPQFRATQERLDRWYFDFCTVLQRNLSRVDVAVELADMASNTKVTADAQGLDISDLQASLDDLIIDVGLLKTSDSSMQAQVGAILVVLAGLRTQMDNHEERIGFLEGVVSADPVQAAMSNKIISANLTLPDHASVIIADYIEIRPGITIDLGEGATLQIT